MTVQYCSLVLKPVVKLFIKCAEMSICNGKAYNWGTGISISITELAKKILTELKSFTTKELVTSLYHIRKTTTSAIPPRMGVAPNITASASSERRSSRRCDPSRSSRSPSSSWYRSSSESTVSVMSSAKSPTAQSSNSSTWKMDLQGRRRCRAGQKRMLTTVIMGSS